MNVGRLAAWLAAWFALSLPVGMIAAALFARGHRRR